MVKRKTVRKVARKTTRKCKGGWLSLNSGVSYERPRAKTRVFVEKPLSRTYVWETPNYTSESEGELIQKRKKSRLEKAKQLARIAVARTKRDEQKRAEKREARRVAEIKRLGKIEELNVARVRANMAVKKARTTSPLNFSFSSGKGRKKITWI